MTSVPQYNPKSTGVKRLMREAMELKDPTEMFYAQPMEDNLFEWHFSVRGPSDSDFDGGIYHGKIHFPSDYPMKPPNLIIMTPNGRFELNKKICLSISGYHPETWLPSWSIRTALLALIGFMPTPAAGAVGSLEYPPAERKKLAKLSLTWKCKECGLCMKDALKPLTQEGEASIAEAKELAAQLKFQDESQVKKDVNAAGDTVENSAVSEDPAPGPAPVSDEAAPNLQQEEVTPVLEPIAITPRPVPVEDSDTHLFVIVPLIIVFSAIFFILLARRLML